MNARSRRRFVNEMMAATAAAMGGSMIFGGPAFAQDPAAGAPAAPAQGAGRGGGRGGPARPPRPRPAGIVWISGTGTERQPPPNTWDLKVHTKLTMDNVKNSIERLGGTMSDFLYMQVFFCLRLDDGTPMPTGSAAFAAYQKGYTDLGSVYTPYWQDTKYGPPPRSCFALSWIPGDSLIEVVGAAYIDPNATPARGNGGA
jgi:enamine deaminase RidA (YjgF/YER057c/UK114 family)